VEVSVVVEDIYFYLVLLLLVIVVLAFVAFFTYVMRMMPSPLLMKVLSTFHSTLFGYESAMIELIGPRGYKSHVFPKIVETINGLRSEDDTIESVLSAKTPKEAMLAWIDVMEKAGITEGAELIDKGNDEYQIALPVCSMCDPIHGIMGDAKGICPNALVTAAASAVVETEKVPVIEYSRLSDTGSFTDLKFVEKTE
jgi:hypothetical protein